jgi:hypothetical protein
MKEIPPRGPRRIGAGSQTLGDHNHRWVRTRERDRAIYGDERTQTRGARETGGNQWETGDSGHRGKHQKIVLFSFVGVGNHFIPSILGLSHMSASLHLYTTLLMLSGSGTGTPCIATS